MVCPGDGMRVAAACELGAVHLDAPLGLTDGQVHSSEHAFRAEWPLPAATVQNRLARVAVADTLLNPPGHPAQRRDHVQERQPVMVDHAGGAMSSSAQAIGS